MPTDSEEPVPLPIRAYRGITAKTYGRGAEITQLVKCWLQEDPSPISMYKLVTVVCVYNISPRR